MTPDHARSRPDLMDPAALAELGTYQPGDDLRYIDGRMYGRSDRFYVKQFEEETNLRVNLLLDLSASMGWSSTPELPSKLWDARFLAAAMALVLLRQGDTVGLSAFYDRIVDRVQPRGGKRESHEILRHLGPLEAGGVSFLLLGSPLDDASPNLPVDAAMAPHLEWILTGWGAAGPGAGHEVAAGTGRGRA